MKPALLDHPTRLPGAQVAQPVYEPPRPNLRPLWIPATSGAVLGATLVLATSLSMLAGAWWILKDGRDRAREPRERMRPTTDMSLLQHAHAGVRAALEARFGPSSGTRTSEEWAAATELPEAFGPDQAARIVEWLSQADHARFAPRADLDDTLVARANTLVDEIRANG